MPDPFDRFRVLTFDCFGTLIDWERGVLDALRPLIARAIPRPTDDQVLEVFAGLEPDEQASRPAALYPDILRVVARRLAAALSLRAEPDDEEALAGSVSTWPPFPDTPPALGALRSRFKLVIVSNVDRQSIGGTIARIGVPFDAVVTAQEVGSYKPAPAHFVRALEVARSLGARSDQVLHVAQSLFHDHVPARAFGLSTVWIDRRQGRPGFGATRPPTAPVRPDWTFPSLATFAQAAGVAGRAGGKAV